MQMFQDDVPEKFDFSHIVVPGVVGPSGCEYLTNGLEVLLIITLIYGLYAHKQSTGMGALGKYMDKRDRFVNYLKVRRDVDPTSKGVPLVPDSSIFLEYCGGKFLCGCLLIIMEVRFRLHPDGKGVRRQGFFFCKIRNKIA